MSNSLSCSFRQLLAQCFAMSLRTSDANIYPTTQVFVDRDKSTLREIAREHIVTLVTLLSINIGGTVFLIHLYKDSLYSHTYLYRRLFFSYRNLNGELRGRVTQRSIFLLHLNSILSYRREIK